MQLKHNLEAVRILLTLWERLLPLYSKCLLCEWSALMQLISTFSHDGTYPRQLTSLFWNHGKALEVEIWGPGLLTTQRCLNTECKEMCEIEEEDEQRVMEPPKRGSQIYLCNSSGWVLYNEKNQTDKWAHYTCEGGVEDEMFNCDSWLEFVVS